MSKKTKQQHTGKKQKQKQKQKQKCRKNIKRQKNTQYRINKQNFNMQNYTSNNKNVTPGAFYYVALISRILTPDSKQKQNQNQTKNKTKCTLISQQRPNQISNLIIVILTFYYTIHPFKGYIFQLKVPQIPQNWLAYF